MPGCTLAFNVIAMPVISAAAIGIGVTLFGALPDLNNFWLFQ